MNILNSTGRNKAELIVCAALCLLAMYTFGCTKRIGDFSILSTGVPQYDTIQNVPLTRTVEGSDGRLWFLIIPLNSAPNLNEAADRCIDQAGGGDFIERARIYETGWSILLLSYGSYSIIGDVGNSKLIKNIKDSGTNIIINK